MFNTHYWDKLTETWFESSWGILACKSGNFAMFSFESLGIIFECAGLCTTSLSFLFTISSSKETWWVLMGVDALELLLVSWHGWLFFTLSMKFKAWSSSSMPSGGREHNGGIRVTSESTVTELLSIDDSNCCWIELSDSMVLVLLVPENVVGGNWASEGTD